MSLVEIPMLENNKVDKY